MSNASQNMQSGLKRARGLGSAKSGTGHWIAQRITAIALIPLVIWFVWSVIGLVLFEPIAIAGPEGKVTVSAYDNAILWLKTPGHALAAIAFVLAMFYHGALGAQVVVEDYFHNKKLLISKLVALKLFSVVAALVGVASVLVIYLQ